MEEIVLQLDVPPDLEGERVDKAAAILSKGELTRTKIAQLIKEGRLLVDGKRVKPSAKVVSGQKLKVFCPIPSPPQLLPQNIPLDIVYEDADLIVVNKPSGMVVHPAAGNPNGTLVNAILHHCGMVSGGEPMRPGIVHRLDKDTSGLMVVAKKESTHAKLASMFGARKVVREYQALVLGKPPDEGVIVTPYGRSSRNRKKFTGKEGGSKRAVTRYRLERYFQNGGVSLIRLMLETGRTHQIRVHMSESGWPVIGDPLYGRRRLPASLRDLMGSVNHALLHSRRMEFPHPTTGEWLRFEVEPEQIFRDILEKLDRLSLDGVHLHGRVTR